MFKKVDLKKIETKGSSRILLIYTGGTLGMVMDLESDSLVPLHFEQILDYMPEIHGIDCNIVVAALRNPVDSSNITPEYWTALGELINENYDSYDGFVIIHGTDTMVYTASALSYMFEGLHKPIIITGSQLPLGLPRSDAKNNLLTSIELAGMKREGKSIINEVCLYFDYELLRGNRSKKIESDHFDAFHSENYPVLAEVGVDVELNEHYLWYPRRSEGMIFRNKFSSDVFNWKLFPGMRLAGISDIFLEAGFKGIVIETYGSGNAPTSETFIKEIKHLSENGVYMLNVSQCLGGSVRQGHYATSKMLDRYGVISGKDITSEAAIVKMMYILANYSDSRVIRELLGISIRGEMTD